MILLFSRKIVAGDSSTGTYDAYPISYRQECFHLLASYFPNPIVNLRFCPRDYLVHSSHKKTKISTEILRDMQAVQVEISTRLSYSELFLSLQMTAERKVT
jgi:hypothetical protein